MSQEIEIEFKNLLTEEEYEALVHALAFSTEDRFTQTNYYFETDQFDLRDKLAALRIRKKGDTWTATLKEPHVDGLLETHDTLTEEEAYQWMNEQPTTAPNIEKQLASLGIPFNNLKFKGALTTERMEKEYNDTLVVLDRSHFNNVTDYELELEAKDAGHGKTIFEQLLQQHGIPSRETPNKIQRFFQSLL